MKSWLDLEMPLADTSRNIDQNLINTKGTVQLTHLLPIGKEKVPLYPHLSSNVAYLSSFNQSHHDGTESTAAYLRPFLWDHTTHRGGLGVHVFQENYIHQQH